jgi:hypothetical protein
LKFEEELEALFVKADTALLKDKNIKLAVNKFAFTKYKYRKKSIIKYFNLKMTMYLQ